MAKFESPETAFTWMYSRLPDGKRVVIYDNACNLLMYIMGRTPHFFQETLLFVDRLHQKNHVNCSSGKSPSLYIHWYIPRCFSNPLLVIGFDMSTFFFLDNINSQAAEQFNSLLQRINTQVSFMTTRNFQTYTKHYMAGRNEIHLKALLEKIRKEPKFATKCLSNAQSLRVIANTFWHEGDHPVKVPDECSCDICKTAKDHK
jgi:hypothetical protein